jgi:hypothetical protein
MSFQSTAQALYVIDPQSPASQLMVEDTDSAADPSIKDKILDLTQRNGDMGKDIVDFFGHHGEDHGGNLEVSEPGDVEIVVEELPGAPTGTQDPEPELEVMDQALTTEDKAPAEDSADPKKKKNEKWDWESKGPHGFVAWVKERVSSVPKHSGYDSAGLERACAYLERLDNEISKAMRMDLDGELDANKIEAVRAEIDDGVARLHARLDKVKKNKKSSRKKKASEEDDGFETTGIVKEAQKITGVQGVYVTVPLLISRIARVCINGMVSAGHDIEDLYARQVKFYKLSDREQAEVQQLLFDMGFPLRQDRGFMPEDALVVNDSNGMDWATNFTG